MLVRLEWCRVVFQCEHVSLFLETRRIVSAREHDKILSLATMTN